MNTIQLANYGVVINRQNIDAVNATISKQMQTGEPFTLDFQGIGAIESSAAYELLEPLRRHYGTNYRRQVHFENVDSMVDDALVFSGNTSTHNDSSANNIMTMPHRSRSRSFISRIFATILLLLTIGVGQMWG